MKFTVSLLVFGVTLFVSPVFGSPLVPTLNSASAHAVSDASTTSIEPEIRVNQRAPNLSTATIQKLDALAAELTPRKDYVVDFGLPKYQVLYDYYNNGSYVPPGSTQSPMPKEMRTRNVPISTLDIEEKKRECSVSASSANKKDAWALYDFIELFWQKSYCDQSNFWGGSTCTTLAKRNSVAFGLCGDYSDWDIPCKEIMLLWYSTIQVCSTSCLPGHSCQAGGKMGFRHTGKGRYHNEEATIFPSFMA